MIVAILIIVAVFAPLIAPRNPEAADPARILLHPGGGALFGTDSSGMDIFSRVVYGARVDLMVALGVTAIAVGIGVPLGVLSGYFRGRLGGAISRSFDVIQSFPVFIVAMVATANGGGSALLVILILGLLFSGIFVRLMRKSDICTARSRIRRCSEVVRCVDLEDRSVPPYSELHRSCDGADVGDGRICDSSDRRVELHRGGHTGPATRVGLDGLDWCRRPRYRRVVDNHDPQRDDRHRCSGFRLRGRHVGGLLQPTRAATSWYPRSGRVAGGTCDTSNSGTPVSLIWTALRVPIRL